MLCDQTTRLLTEDVLPDCVRSSAGNMGGDKFRAEHLPCQCLPSYPSPELNVLAGDKRVCSLVEGIREVGE